MRGYSLAEVSRISGLSQARLRAWSRSRWLRPEARAGAELGFEELVEIRRLRELLRSGLSLRRIRRSLVSIRERLPEVERPLRALRPGLGPRRPLLVRCESGLFEPSGQRVIEFTGEGEGGPSPEPRCAAVTECAGAAGRGLALSWFERGCRLDEDPATQDEAVEAYRRAIAVAPDFADAHCNLGTIHQQRRDAASARRCYERALELDPEHFEANLNLARLLEEEEGRDALALRRYRAALRADPFHPDALVAAALLYERLGAERSARAHWRRYLQLCPEGAWKEIARRHLATDPSAS